MTLVSTALIYVVIWWLVFFMALPIGARSYHEAGEEVEAGNVSSAPMRPRLGLKAGVTTGIAAVLTLIAYFLIDSGALSFRP
jgi:predicted secreted protein